MFKMYSEFQTTIESKKTVKDPYGIVMVESNKKLDFKNENRDDVAYPYLGNNANFPSSKDYDDNLVNNPSNTSISIIKRNYDLGSAHVSYQGNFTSDNSVYDFDVRLDMENLDQLHIDRNAECSIRKAFGLPSEVYNDNVFGELGFDPLNFKVSEMTPQQRDFYYDYLYSFLSKQSSNVFQVLKHRFEKRGFMSSDMMIEAMANGTLDVNGLPIADQENQYNESTRTMGFGRLSIIAICSFLASCAILVLGILFLN